MAATTEALNIAVTGLADEASHMSLHSADPGATGANETSAARQAIVWSTAAGGFVGTGASLAFTGPPSGAVTHAGFWDAATGGTFLGSSPITGDPAFNAEGDYTITSATITGTAA